MNAIKLEKIIEIKAKLVLKTGLYIGAGDSEMHIGGVDNSVIKHPIKQSPYIPGSSIKGKMRTLLEWLSGEVKEGPLGLKDYKHAKNPHDVKMILKMFGVSGGDSKDADIVDIGVSRLSFWDCFLEEQWERDILNDNLSLTEVKSENTINRITSTANHPRLMERVPEGAIFDFKLMLKIFNGDSELELLNLVKKGLRLLELDSLGGSGSRGYGKIKFEKLEIDNIETNLDNVNPFLK